MTTHSLISLPAKGFTVGLLLVSVALAGCDADVGPRDSNVVEGADRTVPFSFSDSDLAALAELGVADVRVRGSRVDLLDDDGVELGYVALRDDGTILSELFGSKSETFVGEGDSLAFGCNGATVQIAIGDRLSAADLFELEACAEARLAGTIVTGAAALPITAPAPTVPDASPLDGEVDGFATPTDPQGVAPHCLIQEQGCWSWTEASGCLQPVTCVVDMCDGWWVCQPGHWVVIES